MATNELECSAQPAEVFAALADGWLYPVWVVGASRMRSVETNWPEPGARLHHSFGVWPLVIDDVTESLEWNPPVRAVMRAHGWPLGSARVVIEVEPRPAGCLVRITEDVDAGPGRLVPESARDGLTKIRNAETLKRLRYIVEGRL